MLTLVGFCFMITQRETKMAYGVDLDKTEFTEEDYNKIIAETTKIIEENSQEQIYIAIAHYNRGWVYYSRYKEDKAISDFTRAIEIRPGFVHAYGMRAASFYALKEYEKALSDVKESLKIDENDQIGVNLLTKITNKMKN